MAVYAFAPRGPSAAQVAAVRQFGVWLQKRYPQLYSAILSRHPSAFTSAGAAALGTGTGLGLVEDSTLVDEPQTSWGQTIADLAKSVLTAYQSHELFRTNLRLAEQGKPPLDPAVYSPSVTVRAGMSPELQQALLWGGLGLAALWIVTLGAKHVRSRQ